MGNNHDSPLLRWDESEKLRHDFGDFPLVPDYLFNADYITGLDPAILSVMPLLREDYTVAEASGVSVDSDNQRSYVELVPSEKGRL